MKNEQRLRGRLHINSLQCYRYMSELLSENNQHSFAGSKLFQAIVLFSYFYYFNLKKLISVEEVREILNAFIFTYQKKFLSHRNWLEKYENDLKYYCPRKTCICTKKGLEKYRPQNVKISSNSTSKTLFVTIILPQDQCPQFHTIKFHKIPQELKWILCSNIYLVSLAAVFWMSRKAPPKELFLLGSVAWHPKNGCEAD